MVWAGNPDAKNSLQSVNIYMSTSKYKQAFQEMLSSNEEEFSKFKIVHDLYRQDPEKWQEKYNEIGKPILELIAKAEKRLCGKMEGSGRGVYSGNLADKFHTEVKSYFPSIDMVGIRRG